MEKIPTAEEYARENLKGLLTFEEMAPKLIEFAQYHVELALEAAADKNLSFKSRTLQRNEILNAYPKELIT